MCVYFPKFTNIFIILLSLSMWDKTPIKSVAKGVVETPGKVQPDFKRKNCKEAPEKLVCFYQFFG